MLFSRWCFCQTSVQIKDFFSSSSLLVGQIVIDANLGRDVFSNKHFADSQILKNDVEIDIDILVEKENVGLEKATAPTLTMGKLLHFFSFLPYFLPSFFLLPHLP